MLAGAADRDNLLVVLGGGVAMDLGGFTASTFMRGIPTLLLPTSLLAMVDAAIGGKTAVNTPAGKNLVGAFHHPFAVLADVECLRSLPGGEMRNGLAEMAKAGVVADESLFHDLVQDKLVLDESLARTADLVARSVRVKAHIVSSDPEDRGRRQVLNFGHTVGHALEKASAFSLPHGDAVAIGMVAEGRMAVEAGIMPRKEGDALEEGLRALGLPSSPGRSLEATVADLMKLMQKDKKRRKGWMRYSIPESIGRMAAGPDASYTVPLDPDLVEGILRKVMG
jgi:3-dehydroquinate synthase